MVGFRKNSGFSLPEVLISASIFTMVVLGISQSVSLMYRYSRSNLCKLQAHLVATSFMESVLYGTHPYETMGNSLTIRALNAPTSTISIKPNELVAYTVPIYSTTETMLMGLYFTLNHTPMYQEEERERKNINPPEGFQSVQLVYCFDSPLKDSPNCDQLVPNAEVLGQINAYAHNALFAIRPILPDDP